MISNECKQCSANVGKCSPTSFHHHATFPCKYSSHCCVEIVWYSRREFLNAQRVQHCRQWGQTVTQWHINPRVVQGEHEAHFLTCRQTTQGDGATSFAVVHTLGYQVVTLQRTQIIMIRSQPAVKHRTLWSGSHPEKKNKEHCQQVWHLNHFFNTPTKGTLYYCYIYFFYQISPTCFAVSFTIFRENLVYLLKTVIFLQGCEHTETCRRNLVKKNVCAFA